MFGFYSRAESQIKSNRPHLPQPHPNASESHIEGGRQSTSVFDKAKNGTIAPNDELKSESSEVLNFSRDQIRSTRRPHFREDASSFGYDWIASMLDNTHDFSDKSDDYFIELQNFRKVNAEECISLFPFPESSRSLELLQSSRSSSGTRRSEGHPDKDEFDSPQPMYRLNERLFPVAQPRPHGGINPLRTEHDHLIRVSIPEHSFVPLSTVAFSKKEDFAPSNSCSLTKHCMLGYETSTIRNFPPQASANLLQTCTRNRQTAMDSRQSASPRNTSSPRYTSRHATRI